VFEKTKEESPAQNGSGLLQTGLWAYETQLIIKHA
jgi:hypothetical protein